MQVIKAHHLWCKDIAHVVFCNQCGKIRRRRRLFTVDSMIITSSITVFSMTVILWVTVVFLTVVDHIYPVLRHRSEVWRGVGGEGQGVILVQQGVEVTEAGRLVIGRAGGAEGQDGL